MKIVLLDEAQQRFEEEDAWWREHRDAKELVVEEFAATLEQVITMPETGRRYRRARGKLIQRVRRARQSGQSERRLAVYELPALAFLQKLAQPSRVREQRPDLRVTQLGDDLVLVSLPSPRANRSSSVRGELTAAEVEVASLAASGLSNTKIADVRQSSHRTVANQLASVYAKLGVAGRRELRARLARR